MTAMLYATLAGGFMPLGGFLARIERIGPCGWNANCDTA